MVTSKGIYLDAKQAKILRRASEYHCDYQMHLNSFFNRIWSDVEEKGLNGRIDCSMSSGGHASYSLLARKDDREALAFVDGVISSVCDELDDLGVGYNFIRDDELVNREVVVDGIRYMSIDPARREVVPDFSSEGFNNGSSQCGFVVGNYRSLQEVVEDDRKYLKSVGLNFNDVAKRMQEIIDFALNLGHTSSSDSWSQAIASLRKKYGQIYGIDWDMNDINPNAEKIQALYHREFDCLHADEFRERRMKDGLVHVVNVLNTRGFQMCPFSGCDKAWSEEVGIVNPVTLRGLVINSGTVHMARDHDFLEKGKYNPYGITAQEFVENFMPK